MQKIPESTYNPFHRDDGRDMTVEELIKDAQERLQRRNGGAVQQYSPPAPVQYQPAVVEQTVSVNQWEKPKEFGKPVESQPFPMNSLPPLLRDYLQAASDFVQVYPEMAVLPLLSVLALCVQGKAVVKHPGNNHTETLNLYTLTVASPGERKSGTFKLFMQPVEAFQQKYNSIHEKEVVEWRTKMAYLTNRLNREMKAKESNITKVQELSKQKSELEHDRKQPLLLNISDTTPESLAWEMFLQGGKMGILDDESSIFDVLSGIYTNGKVNITIFLKSYDGSSFTITRRMQENIMLHSALLTIGLMTQPSHFEEAMMNGQFSGRGFIYRFMFSFPESKFGNQKISSPNIPPELQKNYEKLIFRLLNMPKHESIPVIALDKEASLLFTDYHNHIQQSVRPGGMFEHMKEWASKHFGRALRIAAVLHLCEHEPKEKITGNTALMAISIAKWAENQALKALSGVISATREEADAKYILFKLKKAEISTMSKHELLRLCQRLNAQRMEGPLEFLEDMKYIRRDFIKNSGGGRGKEVISVNPHFLSDNE